MTDVPILVYLCADNRRYNIMGRAPAYINSLELENYKCFKGRNHFYFGKVDEKKRFTLSQCTVFLGDNGTGKTNILKAIANLEPQLKEIEEIEKVENESFIQDYDASIEISVDGGKTSIPRPTDPRPTCKPNVIERFNSKEPYRVVADFLKQTKSNENIGKSTYQLIIRAKTPVPQWKATIEHNTSYGYSSNANYVSMDKREIESLRIDAYGTSRHSNVGSKRLSNKLNAESLFYDDNRLIDIETWILQLDAAVSHNKYHANERYCQLRNFVRDSGLFPGVNGFKVDFDKEFNGFVLFETDSGKYRLNELGYGYQCMFSWVFDFIKKMFNRYPNSKNPLGEPAVLLIDEIDMHLHPMWQRCILSKLCKMFPMTQFIVTTHSPLVVQSMEKINLYVLSRDNDSVKAKHYPDTSFQGWTVEEIMSDLMGLEDDVRSDKYQELIGKLQVALQNRDKKEADAVYQKLLGILHPESIDRELFSMQIEGIDD